MRPLFKLKFIVVLFFLPQVLLSQSAEEISAYSWFDKVIGPTNTGIFNGVEYIEQHRMINELHKFFLDQNFLEGSVIYDGQPYSDLELKYNIFDGLLLVTVQNRTNRSFFQLITEKIDRFTIVGYEFINLKDKGEANGFYEVLLEDQQLQLLKKHSKRIREKTDKSFVYYEFEEKDPDYFLNYSGELYEINSRRDVMRVFPEFRRDIRRFYSSNRKQRKFNKDSFYKGLFQELLDLNSTAETL